MRFLFFLLFTFSITSIYSDKYFETGNYSNLVFKYRAPKGIGYDTGYTTIATFISPHWGQSYQPFVDLRANILNDGCLAANVGIGYRAPVANDKWVLGGNFYYDYRALSENKFGQIGLGFEALHRFVDLRLDTYWPIGSTVKENYSFVKFCGNSIASDKETIFAIPSVFLEAGTHLPSVFRYIDFYIAAGPYFLFDNSSDDLSTGSATGVRGRCSFKVYDGIELGCDVTHDSLFNTRAQGYISITVPFGPANIRTKGRRWREWYTDNGWDQKAELMGRLTQAVYRNEIIPIITKESCRTLNYTPSGCPFSAVFVNNCNENLGNGTYECPFQTLCEAQNHSCPGDLIYVFYGDGTTCNYDTGFCLKENQVLLGSGSSYCLGGLEIPALTPDCYPKITNCSTVITLDNCSTVNGFCILPPCDDDSIYASCVCHPQAIGNFICGGERGIVITSSCKGALIKNNTICNTQKEGILITDSSDFTINRNIIENSCSHAMHLLCVCNSCIENNCIKKSQSSGIVLRAQGGNHTLNNNEINDSKIEAVNISNVCSADFNFLCNTINHNGSGSTVRLSLTGPETCFDGRKNVICSTTRGFDINYIGNSCSDHQLTLDDNMITTGVCLGIDVKLTGSEKINLQSCGITNILDNSVAFTSGEQIHSICLFDWSKNTVKSFELNNNALGLFTVNSAGKSAEGLSADNYNAPVNIMGTIEFQVSGTPCPCSLKPASSIKKDNKHVDDDAAQSKDTSERDSRGHRSTTPYSRDYGADHSSDRVHI